MKILIIEDENLAARKLEKMIKDLEPKAEIMACITCIETALEWFEENPEPDLIISDIQLLDGLSFEIFEQVKTKAHVIFTTAFNQYAIDAFQVNAIDYLLKPIQKDKLKISIDKYKSNQKDSNHFDVSELMKLLKNNQETYKSRFLVKLGQKIRAIPSNKIAYFYTEEKITFLITSERERYPVDFSLEELEKQLNPKDFFRLNRKFIAKFEAVDEIRPYFKGRVVVDLKPKKDEQIVVSSQRTSIFKKWLDQ